MECPWESIETFRRYGSDSFYNRVSVKHVKNRYVQDFCRRCNELKMDMIDCVMNYVKTRNGRPCPKALDIGCGPGSDLLKYKRHRMSLLAMLDASEKNITQLQERLSQNRMTCKVEYNLLHVDREELPYPDLYFDCVFLHFCVSNFNKTEFDLVSFLTKIYHKLRPGGYVSLIMPDSDHIVRILNKRNHTMTYVGSDMLFEHGSVVAFSLGEGLFFAEYFIPNEILKKMSENVGFCIVFEKNENNCTMLCLRKGDNS